MKSRFIVTVLVLLLVPSAIPKSAPPKKEGRDVGKENEVATAFAKARSDVAARPLTRMAYRQELQQLVCTAAVRNSPPVYDTGVQALIGAPAHAPSSLVKCSEEAVFKSEIQRLANYDKTGKQGYRRYSVAVWRARQPSNTPDCWIGIELYGSAGAEFFDNHFTDDMFYGKKWKKIVAPECRDERH